MNRLLTWVVLVSVVGIDAATKELASSLLPPNGAPVPVLGQVVQLALVYNPGAAFGLYLGTHSRWIFMALTVGALLVLRRMGRETATNDRMRALAIALVSAGALGNLIDRARSELGVVDFLDVGFGTHRWPTFNVADMAVSTGAVLLAWVLWREAPTAEETVRPEASAVAAESAVTTGESV